MSKKMIVPFFFEIEGRADVARLQHAIYDHEDGRPFIECHVIRNMDLEACEKKLGGRGILAKCEPVPRPKKGGRKRATRSAEKKLLHRFTITRADLKADKKVGKAAGLGA